METRNRFLTPLLGFLFLLLLLFSEHAFAANRVILSSGDWQDPTIWFRNRVGDEKDSVSLERGTTALTSSAEVTNLKVATSRDSSAGRLRVATGAVLSASRDIVIGYSGRGNSRAPVQAPTQVP